MEGIKTVRTQARWPQWGDVLLKKRVFLIRNPVVAISQGPKFAADLLESITKPTHLAEKDFV